MRALSTFYTYTYTYTYTLYTTITVRDCSHSRYTLTYHRLQISGGQTEVSPYGEYRRHNGSKGMYVMETVKRVYRVYRV